MSKKMFRKDSFQTKLLRKVGKLASSRAFRGSKAMGLTVSYIDNNTIYQEHPDGAVTIKGRMEETVELPYKVKKGLILHAKS